MNHTTPGHSTTNNITKPPSHINVLKAINTKCNNDAHNIYLKTTSAPILRFVVPTRLYPNLCPMYPSTLKRKKTFS